MGQIKSSPESLYAKQHAALSADIGDFLEAQAKVIIPKVVKLYGGAQKSVLHGALLKSDPADVSPDDIPLDGWDDMVKTTVTPVAESVFAAAGAWAVSQLGKRIVAALVVQGEEPKTEDEKTAAVEAITKLVNQDAVDYAKVRAGDLVTQITDSTRQMVADTVASALQDNLGSYGLADRLATSKAFSPQRADLIASYELGTASEAGNLSAWKRSGVVRGKQWLTSSDEIVSDVCTINADQGVIGIDNNFASGDQHPLAHPHCRCTMVAVTKGKNMNKSDFIDQILKYNPNHDAQGRFTTGSSATFVSTTNAKAVERMKAAHNKSTEKNKSDTFRNEASQWIHPSTGEKRIYLNNHSASSGDKVWISESNSVHGIDYKANIRQSGYGNTSVASARAGSNRPEDIASEAVESHMERHGYDTTSTKFADLWRDARPAKVAKYDLADEYACAMKK